MILFKRCIAVFLCLGVFIAVPAVQAMNTSGNQNYLRLDSDREEESKEEYAQFLQTQQALQQQFDECSNAEGVAAVRSMQLGARRDSLSSMAVAVEETVGLEEAESLSGVNIKEALRKALVKGDVVQAEVLLTYKLPISVLNEVCCEMAYDYICHPQNSLKAIEMLLNHGVDVNLTIGYFHVLLNNFFGLRFSGNNNLLQAILFRYMHIERYCSDGVAVDPVYLDNVVTLLVRSGLRVDHANDMGLSALHFAADIGTFGTLVSRCIGVVEPIDYDRYSRIKNVMIQVLREMQELRDYVYEPLLTTMQAPVFLIPIVQSYLAFDRNDELQYLIDYRIPGEDKETVSCSIGQLCTQAKENCIIA